MQLRNGVILSLTLIGILLLALAISPQEAGVRIGALGVGSFLLAYVYAELTRPRG